MSEASDHADGGSIVQPEETALVWSPETGFRLVMPESQLAKQLGGTTWRSHRALELGNVAN